MSYVELHAASAFSFLQGASLPEALVDRAAELGYQALALVDRDGVYGAPRFHKAARAAGIQPIIGAELTIAAGEPATCRAGPFGPAKSAGSDAESAGSERTRPTDPAHPTVQPGPPVVLPLLHESPAGY